MTRTKVSAILVTLSVSALLGSARAQSMPAAAQGSTPQAAADPAAAAVVETPVGYVIGAGDVLGIMFWQEPAMSGDVVVRPDGKISVPLLNDVQAAGLTPQALREDIAQNAKRWIQDPNVTVMVRQINSRAVFITGRIARAGRYALNGSTSILQLIAMAGGLSEWADAEHVVIMRNEADGMKTYRFNYKDVVAHRDLAQNMELRPGDTIIVP
jgi:polysaccharide export outer membrane protein